jgi:hypothetical protein
MWQLLWLVGGEVWLAWHPSLAKNRRTLKRNKSLFRKLERIIRKKKRR